MAAAIASRGFQVIGVDVSERAVECINQGKTPVQETDLQGLIAANRDRLGATLSHREAVEQSDVSFVIVPTPSDERGCFALQYVSWAFKEIGQAMATKQGYHLVVLTSTVLPGSTRFGLLPVLEQASGKVCGPDFGLCYSPEFIALGSVIRDFLNPDFTLVGEFDQRSGLELEALYSQILPNKAPCLRMSIENAELAKVALNTYVTTKITFANMLADLCERIPGGDVDVVTRALGQDSRIGSKYLKGGLAYGGPCFPRDNIALGFLARQLGRTADLAETTDRANRQLVPDILKRMPVPIEKGSTVAVLGLSYKPHSSVIEESPGIQLARSLSATFGARVIAYDPLAGEAAQKELKHQAVILPTLEACLEQADVIMICTPDPAFQVLGDREYPRKVVVVDFWRALEHSLGNRDDVHYVARGRCADERTAQGILAEMWSTARVN